VVSRDTVFVVVMWLFGLLSRLQADEVRLFQGSSVEPLRSSSNGLEIPGVGEEILLEPVGVLTRDLVTRKVSKLEQKDETVGRYLEADGDDLALRSELQELLNLALHNIARVLWKHCHTSRRV